MLTTLDQKFERMRRKTIEGMAHWAGTGPKGTACGDCQHLQKRGALGYGCALYSRMMDGHQPVQSIPRSTRSCKYFERRTQHALSIESAAGSIPQP